MGGEVDGHERGEPDPLDRLGRELRQRSGDGLRADAEDAERDAARAVLRGRSLAEVAALAQARQELVRIRAGGRTWTGRVLGAVGDLVALTDPQGRIDLTTEHIDVLETVAGGAPGGARSGGVERLGVRGFLARLRQLELDTALVTVGLGDTRDDIAGRLLAVARDHLLIESGEGGRIHLALRAVVWVRARR